MKPNDAPYIVLSLLAAIVLGLLAEEMSNTWQARRGHYLSEPTDRLSPFPLACDQVLTHATPWRTPRLSLVACTCPVRHRHDQCMRAAQTAPVDQPQHLTLFTFRASTSYPSFLSRPSHLHLSLRLGLEDEFFLAVSGWR
ncbi:hypothetical protein QYE76_053142 [Lolium multiflorum]|uniref:Uncharacterized protein n=1 Tax=Lolium multiflorum TaxID=4521 RepID=A0AAD8SWX0_LOLMU|nr:hypothetical protein QYE76_053142 [Lolium multiflorum]